MFVGGRPAVADVIERQWLAIADRLAEVAPERGLAPYGHEVSHPDRIADAPAGNSGNVAVG